MYEDIIERVRTTFSIEGIPFPDILLTPEYLPLIDLAHRFRVAPTDYVPGLIGTKNSKRHTSLISACRRASTQTSARQGKSDQQNKIRYSGNTRPIATRLVCYQHPSKTSS